MRASTWIARISIVAVVVVVTSAGVGHADRARNIARAEQDLASKLVSYGPKDKLTDKPKLKLKFSVDWNTVKKDDEASRWAERCGELIGGFGTLCTPYHGRGTPSDVCFDMVNAEVNEVRCVAHEDESDREKNRVERKGKTLVFHMAATSTNRDEQAGMLAPHFPKHQAMMFEEDIRILGETEYNKRVDVPIVIDTASFQGIKISANEAWERCKRGRSFLQLLAARECGFKMCKDDPKKAEAYLSGVTGLKCVYTAKETEPSKEGKETLVYPIGEWSKGEQPWGWTAFWSVRKKLGIRGCGDDRVWQSGFSKNPEGITKACCPKDAKGNCMKPTVKGEPYTVCMTDWAHKHIYKGLGEKCKVYDGGLTYSAKQLREAR